MKIAIIGSRSIGMEYYNKLCENIPINTTQIVSGGAEGADFLAEQYAKDYNISIKIFKPKYSEYGKIATLKRNDEIIEFSDYVIALWDGKSKGTAYSVDKCIKSRIPVQIIICNDSPF